MKNWLYVLCLLIISINVIAQNFNVIDSHALNAPVKLKNNPQKLVEYLIEPCSNQTEKVRSIFVWLADNVAYDVSQLSSNQVQKVVFIKNVDKYKQGIINETLRKGKAICQGYSNTFQYLCELAGINSQVVTGFIKENDGSVFTQYPNHAWNAALVDGEWQLFDVTWGAGSVSKNRFVKKFKPQYFMPNPNDFLQNHLPADPMWQLSNQPITFESFISGNTNEVWKHDFSFQDSLENFIQLSPNQQSLKTAQSAFNFNENSADRMIIAYTNHANQLARNAISLSNQPKSYKILDSILNINQQAIEAQQIALTFDKSKEVVHALGIYFANHATFCNSAAHDLTEVDNPDLNYCINLREEALQYLQNAALYHENPKFIKEAKALTLHGIGYCHLKKAILLQSPQSNYTTALNFFNQTKSIASNLKTDNSKWLLNICNKNIEVAKYNLNILSKNN